MADVVTEAAADSSLDARDDAEARLRVDLAAAYRLLAHYGMDDTIYTHTSVRLPGPEHHFLINPYGFTFDEIRASDLIVVGLDGQLARETPHVCNPAGFTIHSAIHMGREDAMCVMHTHTLAGMTVAALEEPLLMVNQMSIEFYDQLAVHDYEGVALDLDERERLIADLGDKPAMIMANHGLLTVGRTVGEAFYLMYYLEMACRIHVAARSTGRKLRIPSPDVLEHTSAQVTVGNKVKGARMWPAMLRKLDRIDPSFRD